MSKPGTNFRSVINYVFRADKDPVLLGGNMRAESAHGLVSELRIWRSLNERVSKPVFHASLSAAPSDRLTAERWLEIAETYLGRLGYGDSPWIAIRHRNKAHDHIHLVACRIDSRGRFVKHFRDYPRSDEICRQIERDLGLREIGSGREAGQSSLTGCELAAFQRYGQVAVKARLCEHLGLAARDQHAMSLFVERLEVQGVEVRARFAAPDRVVGISFALDGRAFRGADLGYSWTRLQKEISFEPGRDLPALRAAMSRATTQLSTRRPFVRDPGAPPMPKLADVVGAYRQAAALEARADLQQRHDQLAGEIVAARDAGVPPAALAIAALARLPDSGLIRRELLRAGRALGNATVQALSARAAAVFAATARFFGRDAGRGPGPTRAGRGAGRDDDGLGR